MASKPMQVIFFFFAISTQLVFSTRLLQQTTTSTSTSTNSSELISMACRHTQYVDLCKSSLQSHPNSSNISDLAGLVSISLDLSIAHANETISYVTELIRNNQAVGDPFASGCLDDCLSEYGDALDDLYDSKAALEKGTYDTVNAVVSGAMTDSDTCEGGFADKPGYQSPLTERNDYFHKLCSNSLAITGLLS